MRLASVSRLMLLTSTADNRSFFECEREYANLPHPTVAGSRLKVGRSLNKSNTELFKTVINVYAIIIIIILL